MEEHSEWALARVVHGGYLGGKEQPEHYVWRSMLARCNNPNQNAYKHYGGRGIKVCRRWHSYEKFLADMGSRPSPEHSLDRIDTDKDYKLSNCRWATRSQQQKNKTSTKTYTDGNFTGVLVECAEYLGISKALAHIRWKSWGTFQKGVVWRQLQKN